MPSGRQVLPVVAHRIATAGAQTSACSNPACWRDTASVGCSSTGHRWQILLAGAGIRQVLPVTAPEGWSCRRGPSSGRGSR